MKIYHNPRCSKSRQTLALLHDKGHTPVIIEYLKTPLTRAELHNVLKILPSPQSLIREKDAKKAGVTVADLSLRALAETLEQHPTLMERPVVITKKGARLGRPPETVLEIL